MNFIQRISRWYFTKDALPYWMILIMDCICVLFSCYLADYRDLGGMEFAENFWQLTIGNIITVLLFIFGFRVCHTYSGLLRFSSIIDLQRVGMAAIVGTVLSGIVGFTFNAFIPGTYFDHYVLSYLLLFVCSVVLMWIVRMAVRMLYDSIKTGEATNIAIYGTKAGGVSLAHSILTEQEKRFNLRVFISDDPKMSKTYLLGKPVLANNKDFAQQLVDLHVKTLLVSPLKSELFRDNQQMVDDIMASGIKIMMMPLAEEWDGKSELTHERLKEVQIEDLLARDKIEVNMDAIGKLLNDKCILITGAVGSIGSEMVRQICVYRPKQLVLVDQAETPMHDIRRMMAIKYAYIPAETIVASITDAVHMEKIFAQYRPEYVFHAAAYKHVPMMEDNPAQAVRNNIRGTRVIADLAVKYGTKKFVMISTDKAVNPTNVMGCSKRICEIYCQSLNQAIQDGTCPIQPVSASPVSCDASHENLSEGGPLPTWESGERGRCQFVTTRFGNVLGSNGSVIPIFREQIRKGGPVTVTHPDIIRFFMLIPEACKLVLEAGTMGKGGEIFVFDMGKPVRIVDLAKRMIKLSGAKNVEIKFTGLRDGEKLYEEVLNDKEDTLPTDHAKIMVAKVRKYDYATAVKNEDELLQISYTHDDMAIVKKMKEIVPEYKSRHSKYEALDK